MPQAVQADWGVIQQLYMSGVPVLEIERKTGVKQGTICGRASRARWRELAIRAKEAVQAVQEPHEESIGSASKTARERLAKHIVATLDKLPVPGSWSAGAKQHQALESTVRNAKTVFGWGESTQAPAVRISILAQSAIVHEGSSPIADVAPMLHDQCIDTAVVSAEQGTYPALPLGSGPALP